MKWCRDDLQVGGGLCGCGAGFEMADGPDFVGLNSGAGDEGVALDVYWHPEIEATDLKTRRHDTDYGHALSIESVGGAEDVGIAMEEIGPQFVADDENGRRSRSGVCFGEPSTEQRADAERFESVGSYAGAGQFVGSAGAREVNRAPDDAEHVFERVIALLEVYEGVCGKTPSSELVGGINAEGGEAAGVFVRVGIEEDGVDNAEDGGGCSDAEGERENCGGGEGGGFAELAEGEERVGEEGMEGDRDATLAGHSGIVGGVWREC